MEALARNLPGFARFLPIAVLFHTQSINLTEIARDSQVAASTVKGFIEVLEDTMVTSPLNGFEARLWVRERRHPDFYIVDSGLVPCVTKRSESLIYLEQQMRRRNCSVS